MIELISPERCIKCNICVRACPNNVFDSVPDEIPVISRADDCHTCFLCELYCPADAIYVSPRGPAEESARHGGPDTFDIPWGSYAEASGWTRGRPRVIKREGSHGGA